jgi:hypothetical protein
MSTTPQRARKLLTAAVAVVSVSGVASIFLERHGWVSPWVTLVLLIAVIVLIRFGSRYDLFQLVSRGYLPPGGGLLDGRALFTSFLCFEGAILWGAGIAYAVKWHAIPDSFELVGVCLLPVPILIAVGMYIGIKALIGKASTK